MSEPKAAENGRRTAGTVPDWAVVDLFCGIGGLSHGFRQAGFQVVAGVDADETCRYAYETNNDAKFVGRPLEEISGEEIGKMFPDGAGRILVGCAPCTPFSAYASGAARRSDKWCLVDLFMDRVAAVDPAVVSMENVARLTSFNGGQVFNTFLERLHDAGYKVSARVVNAADYGVPQERSRLVVLASKIGPIELPASTSDKRSTVRDAIGQMPALSAGDVNPQDAIHRASRLSTLNLRRIRAAKPGGSWSDWEDPDLVSPCHRRSSGATYKNVYGRMEWDKPAPTLTTGCFSFGRGRFGHPQQDRAISLREAALLQSFPPTYGFTDPDESVWFARVGRHIGNAVPFALAVAIANAVHTHIEDNTP